MGRKESVNEEALKLQLIQRLRRIRPERAQQIADKFRELAPKADRKTVMKIMVEEIERAQSDKHWGTGDRVNIGDYDGHVGIFSTLIGHEVTHAVLDRLLGKKRKIDPETEEPFCYQVAAEVCNATGLPYHRRVAETGLGFNRAVNSPNPEKTIDNLMNRREARILGFGRRSKGR